MPNQPIEDPRIREAIEACRPGSGDLEDPALAELADRLAADPELRAAFERLQRLDEAVAEAFRHVPVPAGLADRITARLAAVRNGQKASAEESRAVEAAVPGHMAEVGQRRPRVVRWWLLAGMAGAAVAASLLLAVMVLKPVPEISGPQEVWDAAKDLFDGDSEAVGELVVESEPPAGFPLSPDFDVSRFPQIRWRWIGDFLGRQGVAYDIRRPGAPRATLYVVKGTVPGLPPAPPLNPSSTTGRRSIGAWQTGSLVYVLVVEGGPRTYQGFLPRRTLT